MMIQEPKIGRDKVSFENGKVRVWGILSREPGQICKTPKGSAKLVRRYQ